MKQLLLTSANSFSWIDVAEPKYDGANALVKVHRVGVCGTDLHAYKGSQAIFSYPRVLGHELAVEVIAAPKASHVKAGDLCTVEAYYPCTKCSACRRGKTNCCTKLQVLGVHTDGGQSPLMSIPPDKLHVGNRLSTDQLALVEPLVIGLHSVERAAIRSNDRVVIMGAGTIGIAAALFARAAGAHVVIVDTNQTRLDFVRTQLGFSDTVLGGEQLLENMQKLDVFESPSVIIDATGNKGSMEKCIELADVDARIVFVGFFSGDLALDVNTISAKELTVLASRAGTAETFASVIRMLENGDIDATPMISHRLAFDSLDRSFAGLTQEKTLIKAIIEIDHAQ
jgi:2-desacetyl-2-hydroxyethyl bacteriochlorophyllide A dehydrogenase